MLPEPSTEDPIKMWLVRGLSKFDLSTHKYFGYIYVDFLPDFYVGLPVVAFIGLRSVQLRAAVDRIRGVISTSINITDLD